MVLVVEHRLRLPADTTYRSNRDGRELPAQGLRAEHDGVGSVQHRIGDVGGLRPRRPRGLRHGIDDACDDHGLTRVVTLVQDHLLGEEHLLRGHV